MQTLFIVDDDTPLSETGLPAIHFHTYLDEYPKRKEAKLRIINLCDTGRYLSQGYYCSLLAEARKHQVLPSVKVINALRDNQTTILVAPRALTEKLTTLPEQLVMCLGEAEDSRLQKLTDWVYQQYRAPILLLTLEKAESGVRVSIKRVSLSELNDEQKLFSLEALRRCAAGAWRNKESKKFRWDLAILTNDDESVPPSNKGAIAKFIKAAEKLGVRAKEISARDFTSLAQYDGLFIRETTAIDHHTYRFASEAEKNGLVVMDDPNSILRCCNKVFLHDAFSYQGVPSLRTRILSDGKTATLDELENELGYPMILKMPEGAFSRGVFKVKTRTELEDGVAKLLADSALYIAQEYMFTEFDWRIGVLNGRALYSCRYYMARNHWQIYNHSNKRNFSGGFDALPTFEVPAHVLQAALRAAAVVGNGLYGIDIKEVDKKAYVLEVNDNPSLESGVEDKYLGEELYMQIMAEFLRRMEARGR